MSIPLSELSLIYMACQVNTGLCVLENMVFPMQLNFIVKYKK